jgi:hypothetical protein
MLSRGTVPTIDDSTATVGDTAALCPQLYAGLCPTTALIVPSTDQGGLAFSAGQYVSTTIRDESALRPRRHAGLGHAVRRAASVGPRAPAKFSRGTIATGENPPTLVEDLSTLRGKTQARGGGAIPGFRPAIGRSAGASRKLPLSSRTAPGQQE